MGVPGLCMKCDGLKHLVWVTKEDRNAQLQEAVVAHRDEIEEMAAELNAGIELELNKTGLTPLGRTRKPNRRRVTRMRAKIEELRELWLSLQAKTVDRGHWTSARNL